MAPSMKHLIRDTVVFLFAFSGAAYIYRQFLAHKPLVRIIAFQDVTDAVWFESVIKMLTESFNVLTPKAFHSETYEKKVVNLLVTFDDGYESWIEICLPILERYNVKALFFINSGLLDTALSQPDSSTYMRDKLQISPKAALTWDMAKILVTKGHTIGGHTVNHKSLRHVSASELEEEVGNDKSAIETNLNINAEDFAYPFGISRDFSKVTEELIRAKGYAYVYTAEPGFVSGNSIHIPRTLVEKNQSIYMIRRWILGSYDLFVNMRRIIAAKKRKFVHHVETV